VSRSNEQSLGDAIRHFLHQYGLERKLRETQLMASWEKVAGKMVAGHTVHLTVKNKVLFVKIDSPALRNELNYSRDKIVRALNKEVNAEVIEEVVFN
jgi:predicted nucleic acid-binding Zn ribbon protein